VEPLFVGLCAFSFLFPALSSIIKERIFQQAAGRLGQPLDVLVVNAYCSASQVRGWRRACVLCCWACATTRHGWLQRNLRPPLLPLLQAGFLLLLLPLSCALKGLTLEQLPAYLQAGAACLVGGTPACGANCAGAPLLPVLYCGVNVVGWGQQRAFVSVFCVGRRALW
jgi:hypothetical protein